MTRAIAKKDATPERCIMNVCSSIETAIEAQRRDVAEKQEAFELAKAQLDNMVLIAGAAAKVAEMQ